MPSATQASICLRRTTGPPCPASADDNTVSRPPGPKARKRRAAAGPPLFKRAGRSRSRIRVRFTSLRRALVRKPMDSRLRGNDINCILAVIPAKAGIHTAYPNTNARPRGTRPAVLSGSRLVAPGRSLVRHSVYNPAWPANRALPCAEAGPPARARPPQPGQRGPRC